MRILFLGTDAFGLPTLNALLASDRHELAGVVTGPDKPAGRGRKLTPSPIRRRILEARPELPVLMPSRLKDPGFHEQFRALAPDAAIVVAYRILPPEIFNAPRLGTLNIHPSLLPKFRGPAPLNWALIEGERETGVSIIRITGEVDAGGIVLQEHTPIELHETAGDLAERLSVRGAELVLQALDGLEKDVLKPLPQNEDQVTRAPKLTKDDGRLDWTQSAVAVHNRARGVTPWPGAFTIWRGETLKLFSTHPIREGATGQPGEILECDRKADRIVVACGSGALEIHELQPSGRKRMSVADFMLGYPLAPGERLGEEHHE